MYKALIICALFALTVCQLKIVNDRETIKSINEKTPLWKAGYNERFADMFIHQIKRMMGARKAPLERRPPVKHITPLEDLPENFDSRQQWPQCDSLKEVRDQSDCGSCWAFGSAEAMSDRICIASKGKLQTRISTEDILSCCTFCGDGCDGGEPTAAYKYWQQNGIPTGGLYQDNTTCQPYAFPPCDHHVKGKYGPCPSDEYPTPKCQKSCVPGYTKSYTDDLNYASASNVISKDEKQIMTELYQNGSVTASFDVYEDFPTYKSGVYHHVQGDILGGHSIKLIGWGVENGQKYWLAVNSWNEGWGENGTFKILRGQNECGIEDEVIAGTPVLPKLNLKYLE
jgi:cathepsin B